MDTHQQELIDVTMQAIEKYTEAKILSLYSIDLEEKQKFCGLVVLMKEELRQLIESMVELNK